MQIKVIGKEKFGEYDKINKFAEHNFAISINVENLGKKLMIHQIDQYLPPPKFSHISIMKTRN